MCVVVVCLLWINPNMNATTTTSTSTTQKIVCPRLGFVSKITDEKTAVGIIYIFLNEKTVIQFLTFLMDLKRIIFSSHGNEISVYFAD